MASQLDALSSTYAALADPTRRAILYRLSQGEATVGDLAAPFAMSGPAITKHLRVLTRAGLISQSRDRQFRPCRIEPAPLEQAAAWVSQYRVLWEGHLERLDHYLQELQRSDEPATVPPAGTSTNRKSKKGERDGE